MQLKILGCCIMSVLLLAAPSFAQNWQFAYEMEENYQFFGVDFPSSTVGYVVGDDGVIFKTINGGSAWTQQTSPVTGDLLDVSFTSETTGWAVGKGGLIIYTTDGTNWTEHDSSTVMTTQYINVIKFIGNKGWMGDNGGTIWLTLNGGADWTAPTTNPYTDDVTDLDFVDANIGYAAVDGDGIVYTTDGGVNWNAAAVNIGPYPYTRDDIEVIMMIDDTLAVAAGWGSPTGIQPTIILVTEDAGQTWTTPDITYHWYTHGYGYGLGMFDDGEIVLTGGALGCAGYILHSTDSGNNWTSSPAVSGDYVRDCCAIPGTDGMVAVGANGLLALSTDKAQTWSYALKPGTGFNGWHDFTHTASHMIIGSGAHGSLIRLMQDDTGVPTGEYRFSVVAPQNWAPTVLKDVDYIDGVLYASGSHGYLCKSTDMGDTWTQLAHAPTTKDGKYGMHWFDVNNGIIVGEINSQETIWTTNNGGTTLTVVWNDSTGTTLQFNSISFAPENPLVGVICGDDTALVYTNNGGTTWNWANTGVTGSKPDLEEVHMVSATDGWVVGDAGTVLKTTDGGANWTVQTNPSTTVTLMDVTFRGPDQPGYGWICGDNQVFFYTDDGGATWTAANPTLDPTTKDINTVYFQNDAGRLWIGVDYGDVLCRFGDAVTAIETLISLPYVLGQNYPNPFNPSTAIEFSLPTSDQVNLVVYDVRGRLVATVLNKKMVAGPHTVHFDAKGLSSGIYFYKLTTNAGVETKKMVLIR